MGDIYAQVGEVARDYGAWLSLDDPLLSAVRIIDKLTISIIPVFEESGDFQGTVGIHEISDFFIFENTGERPEYLFLLGNIEQALSGEFVQRGNKQEFSAPIMTGAMPLQRSIERLNSLHPKKPVLVVGERTELLEYAVKEELPAIILTGLTSPKELDFDFSAYKGSVFISLHDTAETIRLLRLAAPVKHLMNASPLKLDYGESYDEGKSQLINSEYRGIPVFREGKFAGIVTRRCFIEKPRKKLILVDHNEIEQSVPGAEEAEILEIIDHHRLGAQKTKSPIYISFKPIGSTCTIVYQHFTLEGITLDKVTATLLLSGILSDTVLLKSPTAKEDDAKAVEALAKIADVDYMEYGRKMFSETTKLEKTPAEEIIGGDFKTYKEHGQKIGIGQFEVVTLENIDSQIERLRDALEEQQATGGYDWTMLLVSDVLRGNSRLLSSDFSIGEDELLYRKIEDHVYDLPGVLSRKKQLLPEILRILEKIESNET
ncbi:MAG: putative manganese-dependent inorganic diphosphatase [Spirochaetia bacterium]